MLTLAPIGTGSPVLAAPVLNGRPRQPIALTRSDEALQFQKVGLGRQVALFGRDRVVATAVRHTLHDGQPWVAFGRIGHALGRREPLLAPSPSVGSVVLAANSRGESPSSRSAASEPTPLR